METQRMMIQDCKFRIRVFPSGSLSFDLLQSKFTTIYEEFLSLTKSRLVPLKPLNPVAPWKTVQDCLNALPPSAPLTTVTPLGRDSEPIRSLKSDRKTKVMAIFNMTPDSFSDGGVNAKLAGSLGDSNALDALTNLAVEQGASIIDIGGQSTQPNIEQNPTSVELERVVPVIKSMRTRGGFTGLISVDTYRSAVAEAAINAGADIINDISAGQLDPKMLKTMARLGKTVILMHMRGDPSTMSLPAMRDYSPEGLIPTIAKELLERVAEAEAAGIYRWRIILDPGIGFAKQERQALEILRRFDELRNWPGLQGFPWLVGSSRKKFIQRIIGVKRGDETQYGTAATVAAAIAGGADIVRVHDVRQMSQVAKVSDAIWRLPQES
jgi:2-amino-4-hydroxy-6-hydroxymethyldihydropteridine diphosphokinase/dihydropteroate synthase